SLDSEQITPEQVQQLTAKGSALMTMTVEEMKAWAADLGINPGSKAKKGGIAEALIVGERKRLAGGGAEEAPAEKPSVEDRIKAHKEGKLTPEQQDELLADL